MGTVASLASCRHLATVCVSVLHSFTTFVFSQFLWSRVLLIPAVRGPAIANKKTDVARVPRGNQFL